MSKKKHPNSRTPANKKKEETKETLITVFGALLVLALIIGVVVAILHFGGQSSGGDDGLKDYVNMGQSQQPSAPAIDDALMGTPTHNVTLEIENYGTITLELYGNLAPVTVQNFVSLAQEGFYNGLTFHRIIEGFMMQGGAPKGGDKVDSIVGEFSSNGFKNPLAHTRGVISMARAEDPNSASSQFFIMHDDAPHLDGKYAAFGFVTSGIEVVDAICTTAQPVDGNGSIATSAQPVIKSLTVTPVE